MTRKSTQKGQGRHSFTAVIDIFYTNVHHRSDSVLEALCYISGIHFHHNITSFFSLKAKKNNVEPPTGLITTNEKNKTLTGSRAKKDQEKKITWREENLDLLLKELPTRNNTPVMQL